MLTSALTLDPCKYLVFAEAPVFPQSVAWQPLRGSFPHTFIDPGDGDLQQHRYFMDSEKVTLSPFVFSRGRALSLVGFLVKCCHSTRNLRGQRFCFMLLLKSYARF
jgi:hypothetical protein